MPRVVEAAEPDIVEEIDIIAQLRSVIVVLEDDLAPTRITAGLPGWRLEMVGSGLENMEAP